jgi:hypothetical protein
LAARGAHTDIVVAGGGVITTQPRLFAAFRRALGERLPDVRVVLLDTPPVQGALTLALRAERGR